MSEHSSSEARTYLINKTRARLCRQQLCIGLSLRMVRHVDIGRLLEIAGFDFGFIDEEAAMRRYIQMGARFILSGKDIGLLLAGMQQRARMLRDIVC